jgi:hypothetical protein
LGVDARKSEQKIDCATASKEIDSIKQFVAKLNEFTGQAVSPIVGGIRHKPLETNSGKGFAATLVPESVSGPHMAKLGEDRYYKRSGDSFYVMEHFDLEDMFGRRQKPKLRFDALPIIGDGAGEGLVFRIQNVGRGVAKYVGFFADLTNIKTITEKSAFLHDVSQINPGCTAISYDKNQGVLHPHGMLTEVGRIRLERNNPAEPVTIHLRIYCENMLAEVITLGPFFAPSK